MLAFLLPLYKPLVPVMIVIWALSVLPACTFENIKKYLKVNGFLFACILFYMWYVLGVFYSEDKASALFDLEVKLSLFIFPLFFSFIRVDDKLLSAVYKSFIEGNAVAIVLCLMQGFYSYAFTGQTSNLFYTDLSVFHHPGYSSLYVLVAFVLVAEDIMKPVQQLFARKTGFFLLGSFVLFTLLLFAKMSLILMGMLIFYYLFRFKKNGLLGIKHIFMLLLCLLFFIGFVLTFETIQVRFTEFVAEISSSQGAEGGTGARTLVWKSAVELLKDSPFIGYGQGDIKALLVDFYKEHGFLLAYEKQLNTHNQFLQTALALGVPALFFMLFLMAWFFRMMYRNTCYTGMLFMGIVCCSLAVESMFETQAGVVFIFFMLSLFYKFVSDSEKTSV